MKITRVVEGFYYIDFNGKSGKLSKTGYTWYGEIAGKLFTGNTKKEVVKSIEKKLA